MDSEWIEVEVVKWEDYNPRADRKRHSWFRLENGIAAEQKFFGLTAAQKFVAICLFAEVSKSQGTRIRIHVPWLADLLKVSLDDVFTTHQHLVNTGVLREPESEPIRATVVPISPSIPSPEPTGDQPVTDRTPGGDQLDTSGNQLVTTGITTYVRTYERTNERTDRARASPHPGQSGQDQKAPDPNPSPPQRITPTGVAECRQTWLEALAAFGQPRETLLAAEELAIARAIMENGADTVQLALYGARFEPEHEGWKPKDHVDLMRVLTSDKQGRPRIQKFVGYGTQSRVKEAARKEREAEMKRQREEPDIPDDTPADPGRVKDFMNQVRSKMAANL